jgi:hypothetical protein
MNTKKLKKSIFIKLRKNKPYHLQRILSVLNLGVFSSYLKIEVSKYLQKRNKETTPRIRRRK